MQTYFEKMYLWEEFLSSCKNKKINIVGNVSSEERSKVDEKVVLLKENNDCIEFLLKYNYEDDNFECNNQKYDLKAETLFFLKRLDIKSPVVLNISSMNLRLIGALLFNVKKLHFKEVYCLYTEPKRYCRHSRRDEEDELNDEIDSFDLYRNFKGIEPIPGFLRANDDNLKEKWIVFLGFDGKRVEQINDKYEFTDIVPVVTLPSFRPGWHNYALKENIDMIKKIDRKLEYVIANSYMSAYKYLVELQKIFPNNYLRISPLGTKINALGAVLFCLTQNKNVELLYDNPKDEGKISKDSGTTYVFDISEIINMKK